MDRSTIEDRLQREIDVLVSDSKDVFSAVLGVTKAEGDFHWSGATGTAYAGKTQAMTADTPFFVASITKVYTAAATMILEERGLLSLDDPIHKFLPSSLVDGLHRYRGRDYSAHLRIYHLISQTSGLPDYFLERPKGGKSIFDLLVGGADEQWDVERVVEIAKSGLSPKFPPESMEQDRPGKKAYYSDTNYQLLGAVIESVAQKPFHEVLSELIIEPLELSSTYVHGYGESQVTRDGPPAHIYYKTTPLQLDRAMTSFGADGGMVSNVGDSLTFLRHLLEGRLFAHRSTLERMKSWKRIFFPFQYGLGLMRFKLPRLFSPFSATPELIGHSGSTSSFLFYSERDQLYIGGTLNQVQNQGRPFQFMLKIIKIVREVVS
jgi:CubicO group peptidase (beta-lactamase class C family)